MTETVLFAQTRDGTQRVELPQATIESYTYRLNQPGALTAGVAPQRLPDTDGRYTIPISEVLQPGVHELGVRRDGEVVWLGPLRAVDEEITAGARSVSVTAEGLLSYLWQNDITTTLPGTSPPGQFKQVDQATIVQTFVDYVVGKGGNWMFYRPINLAPTGIKRDRTEYQSWRGVNVGEAISQLSGVDKGFDFSMGPDRAFKLHYPRQGRRRDEISIEETSMIELRRTISSVEQASTIMGYGDGFAEGTIRRRQTDSAAVAKFGYTEGAWVGSGVTNPTTIDQHVAAELKARSKARTLLSLTIRFGESLPFGSFSIGDEIRIIDRNSPYEPLDTWRRVIGIDVRPHPDETAVIHLE